MTFKKTEKELIKAIVKYGDNEKSLAEVLHQSKLLEKRGIAIVHENNQYYVFIDKSVCDYEELNVVFGYIAELMSLISMLIENRYIVLIPFGSSYTHTIGVYGYRGIRPYLYTTDNGDFICLEDRNVNWFHANQQKCWPFVFNEKQLPLSHFFNCPFCVSQELKDLVRHNFKTEEQRRFSKQQQLTWISIIIASIIGLSSLIVGVVGIMIR